MSKKKTNKKQRFTSRKQASNIDYQKYSNYQSSGGGYGGTQGGYQGMGRPQRNNYSENRTLYPAVCSDCGSECQVPFEPAEGKPVYCRNCYPKHRKPRY